MIGLVLSQVYTYMLKSFLELKDCEKKVVAYKLDKQLVKQLVKWGAMVMDGTFSMLRQPVPLAVGCSEKS